MSYLPVAVMTEDVAVCPEHWCMLENAVTAAGYAVFVADDAETAAARLLAMLRGDVSVDTFEPLIMASFVIIGELVSSYGPRYLAEHPGCPICVHTANHHRGCEDPGCDWSDAGMITDTVDLVVEDYRARVES